MSRIWGLDHVRLVDNQKSNMVDRKCIFSIVFSGCVIISWCRGGTPCWVNMDISRDHFDIDQQNPLFLSPT